MDMATMMGHDGARTTRRRPHQSTLLHSSVCSHLVFFA
jgi:hypothetical protein